MSVLRPLLVLLLLLATGAAADAPNSPADQVRQSESRFAQTMADRDVTAFERFLDDEAVFFGTGHPLRGPQEIVAAWRPFFENEAAPFSWEPEVVEVLESGTLALSSGPVYGLDGRRIGTFNSIWRKQADGTWRVVFDKGCDWCESP